MIVALLLIITGAEAPDPPRPTPAVRTSQQSVADLQSCFARIWLSKGRITPLAVSDGVDLYFQLRSFGLGGPGKEIMVFEIRDKGSERRMTVYYRRPWSEKNAVKLFNETVDRCEATTQKEGI
jgi:hypothetical protein